MGSGALVENLIVMIMYYCYYEKAIVLE